MAARKAAQRTYNFGQYSQRPELWCSQRKPQYHAPTHESNHMTRSTMHRTKMTVLASLVALAFVSSFSAHADEYADVNRLLRSGDVAGASALADKFLQTKPRDMQMRFLKGLILTEQGKSNEAIAQYLRLTEDFPEMPEPYNNLAVVYSQLQQFDKSRAALEMAIRTNPSYATAHENLGDVYAKLSGQSYARALQIDGGNTAVQPKLNLIRTLFGPNARPIASAPSSPPSAVKPPATVPTAPPATAPVTPPAPQPTPVAASSSAAKPALPASVVKAPPPAAPPVAATPPAANLSGDNTAVEASVRGWAQAWASKDVGRYLGAYGKDFDPTGSQSRASWEEERKQRIVGKRSISVGVSDLQINVSGGKATARFRQDYKADALSVNSRKTLELVRSGDRWVIVREATGG